jgi:hypothetical protein
MYPEEKLAIHRIAYDLSGKKVLLSVSHQFKTSFRNPEDIRKFIFTEDDKEESIFEIINWLKKISQKKVAEGASVGLEERRKQAEYFAHQYKSGVSVDRIVFEMTVSRFLGENSISCGGGVTVSGISSGFENTTPFPTWSEYDIGWHSGTCRVCGISAWVGPCEICQPCASKM